tara:strand:- start:106 stop:207 length:102 start_codon:yes stop_codon:yes gene_type:complete
LHATTQLPKKIGRIEQQRIRLGLIMSARSTWFG